MVLMKYSFAELFLFRGLLVCSSYLLRSLLSSSFYRMLPFFQRVVSSFTFPSLRRIDFVSHARSFGIFSNFSNITNEKQIHEQIRVAVVAIVNANDQVYVTRRTAHQVFPHKYEFPGGKVEIGELVETAAARELLEEIGVIVSPDNLVPLTFRTKQVEHKKYLVLFWVTRTWTNIPNPQEGQQGQFYSLQALRKLDLLPADAAIREDLITWIKKNRNPDDKKDIREKPTKRMKPKDEKKETTPASPKKHPGLKNLLPITRTMRQVIRQSSLDDSD